MSGFLDIASKVGVFVVALTTMTYGFYIFWGGDWSGWGFISIGLILMTVEQIQSKIYE